MAQQSSATGMHRIHTFVDRFLVLPAYVLAVVGNATTVLVPRLNSFFPYGTWPLWLRVGLDVTSTLGILLGPDLAGVSAAIKHRLLGNERERVARGPKRKDRETVLAAIDAQRRERIRDVAVNFSVVILFGIIGFTLTTAAFTWQSIASQIVALVGMPLIIYQIAARYEAPIHDPGDTARTIATEAFYGKMTEIGHKAQDTLTHKDVGALRAAMAGNIDHALMMIVPDSLQTRMLTVREVADVLQIQTAPGLRQIRRIVARAAVDGRTGITRAANGRDWLIPATALYDLFADAANFDHTSTTLRPRDPIYPALQAVATGHTSTTLRPHFDHTSVNMRLESGQSSDII